MTERRADEATRDVVAFLKCFFMQDRVGEMFTGSVSAVVPFGLFIALDDIFIEGLLHISDLGSDYFHYDETRHALLGERSGKQFRLSDRVKVQLVRVDMASNKIDFRFIEGPLTVGTPAPAPAPAADSVQELPTPQPKRGRRTQPVAEQAPDAPAPEQAKKEPRTKTKESAGAREKSDQTEKKATKPKKSAAKVEPEAKAKTASKPQSKPVKSRASKVASKPAAKTSAKDISRG